MGKYKNVSEMVKDISDSQEFVEAFEERLSGRELIQQLMIMRASQNLSQDGLAKRLGCSQSWISKLENGTDSELNMGDFMKYAAAVGLQPQIVCFPQGATTADLVKFHFFRTKELLDNLIEIASGDDSIIKGAAGFLGEAAVNYVQLIVDNAKKLPKVAHEVPLIKLICSPEEGDCVLGAEKPKIAKNNRTDMATA